MKIFNSIGSKIILLATVALLLSVTALTIFNNVRLQDAVMGDMVKSAKALGDFADSARSIAEEHWKNEVFDEQEFKSSFMGNKYATYSDSPFFLTIPIISTLKALRNKEKELNVIFSVHKVDARNPKHEAQGHEKNILNVLKQRFSSENGAEIWKNQRKTLDHWEVDPNTDHLVYYKPVVLTDSCLSCHGTKTQVNAFWGIETGIDPTDTGVAEGWSDNEIHGMFKFEMSLAPLRSTVFNNIWISVIVTIGLLILVIILFTVILRSQITQPINVIKEHLAAIASGNLNQPIDIRKSDEIGMLAKSVKQMNQSLLHIVQEISEVSQQLAASSEEISAVAYSFSEGSQSTAASVEQTTASIVELNNSVNDVAENAEHVKSKSQELLTISKDSTSIVNEVITGMKKIENGSQQVTEILQVILDIADQTNLLSLNASIEAARAGEYGRGFAVVAQEVSKLADKSAASSKDVSALIKENLDNVNSGTLSVHELGKSFDDILQGVEENTGLIEQITQAVEQQKDGSDQIKNAIETVNDITQSNSAAAEQLSANTDSLKGHSQVLLDLVKQFQFKKATKSNAVRPVE